MAVSEWNESSGLCSASQRSILQRVTFWDARAASELVASLFGCGFDSVQGFVDAAAELFVARDGQFGYPVSDWAPQKLVGLDHLGTGAEVADSVAPQRFFTTILVQRGECKILSGVGSGDDRIGVPPDFAEPVMSAESGAWHRGRGAVALRE